VTEGVWYKSDVDLLTATVRAVKSASEPYTLVTLVGEADVTNHDQLRAVLAAQVAKAPRTLIVDLAGLEFMDSSALHEILRASRAMDAHGGVFALAAPRDAVATILKRTATDQLIPVYPTVDEAAEG
jgi:anti-sigma B factor antagonist